MRRLLDWGAKPGSTHYQYTNRSKRLRVASNVAFLSYCLGTVRFDSAFTPPIHSPHISSQDQEVWLAEVIIGDNESFEAALKRFTKRVQQDGILAEARRREHYEKPSIRRKKKAAAKRRKSRKTAA
jgi:small subunit ribosomal protein S21